MNFLFTYVSDKLLGIPSYGEESLKDRDETIKQKTYSVWDPVDGTGGYVNGLYESCGTLGAVMINNEPVGAIAYAPETRALSNIPSHLIPLASLQRWVANMVDPIYRKHGSKLSVENIIQNLEAGIPFLSKNLESYKTPLGAESKRQYPFLSAVSPIGITKENEFFAGSLDMIQQKKRLDLIKKDLKERLRERIMPNL